MSSPSFLSTASRGEQACSECRRRKARCDRRLPECTSCSRSTRRCVYQKEARTPLTRRHLSTVEERLRRAEKELEVLWRRAREGQAGSEQSAPSDGIVLSPLNAEVSRQRRQTGESYLTSASTADGNVPVSETPQARRESAHGHISDAEDLSWDEQTPSGPLTGSYGAAGQPKDRAGVADGMASLSVEAKGSGYLGSASGAAMLRMLLPADQHRRSLRGSSTSQGRPPTSQTSAAPMHGWVPTRVYHERNIGSIDLDAAINAYFSLYHVSYPIVHEPSFRAEYMQVIPRPGGNSWNALAYIIAALGIFTTSSGSDNQDIDLCEAAKANISLESLESGNITLVQTLTLMSNYLQKRNKPNSGYNYLGLALHMAMGIGLHKDFSSAKIRPLAMEIRRRVWWTLQVFAVGAMITFGRPLSWPAHGIEAAIPLNIDERDLTHASTSLPPAREGVTTYSSVIWQTRFHLFTNTIYTRVINASFSSVDELLALDDTHIESWRQQWSAHISTSSPLPPKYKLSISIMEWRYRNFRIIMYRPFVIRHALRSLSNDLHDESPAVDAAISRCMHEARETIRAIQAYWLTGARNRLSAWYALYFLFQASLIPCVRLRNEPGSGSAQDWRALIRTALEVIGSMGELNAASGECSEIILRLVAGYLGPVDTQDQNDGAFQSQGGGMLLEPIEESPLTQIDNIYSMMWPGTDILDFGMDGQNGDFDFNFNLGMGTDM